MVIKRFLFFAAALLLLSIKIYSQPPSKLTLRECIETAIKNNIPVKQSALQTERDEINWKQAKANMLPNLNGSFSYGWNDGRIIDPFTNTFINQQLTSSGVGLSSSITLFNGLRLQNAIKQTSYAYQASKMDYEQAKNNLTLNVLLTYLQVLNNEDLLEISRNQADVTRKQVERLDVMVREGAVGQFQLSNLKGQLANDQIAIINSGNNLQSAKLTLCQLMNIPYNRELRLDRESFQMQAALYDMTSEGVYAEAMQNFAQVKATDLRVKSFEKAVKATQGNYFPLLSFGGNLSSNYSSAATLAIPTNTTETPTGSYVKINSTQYDVLTQQQNFTSEKIKYGTQLNNNLGKSYGFSLQLPLFNNFFTRNQVKISKIILKNAELENANIKLLLRQNIEQAHQNMTATYERYKALAEQVSSYEISFNAAEIRFNTGVINAAEYLIEKNNLDRAKVNLSQATYEYILRIKILDFYRAKALW